MSSENTNGNNKQDDNNIKLETFKSALDFLMGNYSEGIKFFQSELCMPNIPMPTLGGHTFWDTLAEYNGYKLQQNLITRHARILNSDDVRIAWGTVNGMKMTLERMAEMSNKYTNKESQNKKNITDVEQELLSAKKLLYNGIISSEEFNTIKKKLLDQVM